MPGQKRRKNLVIGLRLLFSQFSIAHAMHGNGYIFTSGLKFDPRFDFPMAGFLQDVTFWHVDHVLGHFWSIF